MMFARYGQAVLTVHERQSRLLLAMRLASKAADSLSLIIWARLFSALPQRLRQTVTFDNGTEFARHRLLHRLDVETFFCDPYSPWQKGGIENAIGRMRRFLPRKTDLATLTSSRFGRLWPPPITTLHASALTSGHPPKSSPKCRISSAVHSTTLPPLREAWRAMASPSRPSFLIEHDLFGKPVSTFPDHARQHEQIKPCRVARGVLGHRPEKGKRVFGELRGPRKAAHSREGGNPGDRKERRISLQRLDPRFRGDERRRESAAIRSIVCR